MTEFKFHIGGMWEQSEWSVRYNEDISEDCGSDMCPHCHSPRMETVTRPDTSTFETKHWICPRVIVVYNESGCNSTGLCLDCVLDVGFKT